MIKKSLTDCAFVYKKNRNYFYAISKTEGKVVFSDFLISQKYSALTNFFFISYSCFLSDLELYRLNRRKVLYIFDINIEYISSYRDEYNDIYELVSFFDYKIGYNIYNKDLFDIILKTYWFEELSTKECLAKMQYLL